MSASGDINRLRLPGAWTELGQGLTRQQIENVLQFNAVTAYLDDKPVAVILSIDEYQRLYEEAFGGPEADRVG